MKVDTEHVETFFIFQRVKRSQKVLASLILLLMYSLLILSFKGEF